MAMQIFSCLDWITATFPICMNIKPEEYAPQEFGQWEEKNAIRPYNTAIGNNLFTLHWHTEHPEFKTMMRLDGAALTEIRSLGMTDEKILRWIMAHDGKFTRLDFAVDIFEQPAPPDDLLDAYESGQVQTEARTMTVVRETDIVETKGITVYFGSRSSERLLRVYNKGAQQKVNFDWTRVELEAKGRRAEQLARNMLQGIRRAGLATIRDFVPQTTVPWFESLFDGDYEDFPIESLGRKETDHERWVREVCLPNVIDAAKSGNVYVTQAIRALIDTLDNEGVHGSPMLPSPR